MFRRGKCADMQGKNESRRILLRPFTRRQRLSALMRSTGFNIYVMPKWFTEPMGGWKNATPEFTMNYVNLLKGMARPKGAT